MYKTCQVSTNVFMMLRIIVNEPLILKKQLITQLFSDMSFESPKRTNQRAALYKGRSPSWKESLKSKCRLEMKARRHCMMNRMRKITIDDDSMINDVLYSEFLILKRELRFSFNEETDSNEEINAIMEEIKQELLFEAGNVDTGNRYFEEMFNSQFDSTVICPICQKNNLEKTGSKIVCPCGIELCDKSSVELHQIENSLSTATDLHSSKCQQIPLFAITEDFDDDSDDTGMSSASSSMLMMQCNFCQFFYRIV